METSFYKTDNPEFQKVAILGFLLFLKMMVVVYLQSDRIEWCWKNKAFRLTVLLFPLIFCQQQRFRRRSHRNLIFWFGTRTFRPERMRIVGLRHFCNEKAFTFKEYDALIVNVHEKWLTGSPYFKRRPHQRFIFMTQESPASMFLLQVMKLKNYFNWTMN
jgi:hypothetical protein